MRLIPDRKLTVSFLFAAWYDCSVLAITPLIASTLNDLARVRDGDANSSPDSSNNRIAINRLTGLFIDNNFLWALADS